MIYTELTREAMNIAYKAHHKQKDKGGFPYINHPFHLAEQMDDEYSTCVALLHDVVEDKVKLADLAHNLDRTRLIDKDLSLVLTEKYLMAYTILRGDYSGT